MVDYPMGGVTQSRRFATTTKGWTAEGEGICSHAFAELHLSNAGDEVGFAALP